MEIERFQIPVQDVAGAISQREVTVTESGDDYRVVLSCGNTLFSGEASDIFAAFAQIRIALRNEGATALCYASSKNVFPSPMSRSMGGGLKAYRLTSGKQALKQDLVCIFDTGPDIEPVSPTEQQAFFDSWLRSLGQGNG
jgi:hypothetical protein